VSADEARRIAFAAQGFDRERPSSRPDSRHFRRVLEHMGLLQLDFVNVLLPAQYLMLWSRLGAYDRARFDQFAYTDGNCTEQWAHEASIVPVAAWPLLAYRRECFKPWKNSPITKMRNREAYLDEVLQQVRRDGAVTANDLPPVPGPKRKPGDWHRSIPRWALEYHFGCGRLTVADRMPNFQRVYDIPERVIPQEHLNERLPEPEARTRLLLRAAKSLGIATLPDLADYYRMTPTSAAALVAQLVESGQLQAVSVEGWGAPAYLYNDARVPRRISGASLLSPFDPMVWFRPRAERLFDFHYRIEIYVPEAKRKWGYYVLPFRIGSDIVGRVDLNADRKNNQLLVQAAHEEAGFDREKTATNLATELQALADWLGLGSINIRCQTPLAKRLAAKL